MFNQTSVLGSFSASDDDTVLLNNEDSINELKKISISLDAEANEFDFPEGTYSLPRLLSLPMACILDDAADKLSLILNVGGLPKHKTKSTTEENENEKYQKTVGEVFDPMTIEPIEEALNYQQMIKFQKDVHFLRNILKETRNSLYSDNNFDCLVKKLKIYKRIQEEKTKILVETASYKQEVEYLQKLLQDEINRGQVDIQKMRNDIAKLKEEVEQKKMTNSCKMRYLEKWENSRQELNSRVLEEEEQKYKTHIWTVNNTIDREKRVNEEIENFIAQQQKEYEDSIQVWMERYDAEMEQLDLDISVTNEKIEEQMFKNADIKNEFERRTKFIEEWLIHKEKKRLAKERLERIFEAAFTIQCWWRSVMVRYRLGPYGKKKGKKR